MLVDAWRADFERGLARLQAGDFVRAEQYFAKAYARAPERPEVCFALGRELLRQGKHTEAEPLLRRAWDADPSLSIAAAALARCLALADPPAGLAVLEDLGEDQLAEVIAFSWVGQGTYEAADWDEAMEEAQSLVADGTDGAIDEIMEQPMLASVLESGLAAFELSCDGVGDVG